MARKAQSGTKSDQKPKRQAQSPEQKHAKRSLKDGAAPQRQVAAGHLVDERTRRDIWGVVCAVLAIIFFVVAMMPASGLVTTALSNLVHVGLGSGAFVLPFVMILISATFFAKPDGRRVPARVAVGLLLMFVAFLMLRALFTPGVSSATLDPLFMQANLVSQGGYVGAGMAWVFMILFGKVVSTIIAIGLLIVSLLVMGLSVSGIVDFVRDRKDDLLDRNWQDDMLPAVPASIRRGTNGAQDHVSRSERATMAFDAAFEEEGEEGFAEAQGKVASITRKLSSKPAKQKTDPQAKTVAIPEKKKKEPAAAAPNPSEGFTLPSMDMLTTSGGKKAKSGSEEALRRTALLLQDTLADFGVNADVVGWVTGPTVTLYKVDLPSGVRVSRVTNLTDDIALALAATGVRIFAPIPGTNYVGIEVPNPKRQMVLLGDILSSAPDGPLQVVVGEDVEGNYIIDDLSKMPHLLVAGTTGSGKSVAVNGMIMSILMRATPAEVRFIMIDPKRVEFGPYNGIPHLYVPVVTECREAASALSWAVAEMENRLKTFAKVGARDIGQYNAKAKKGMQIGDESAQELPYIVIVIDELADLMMNVGKEVEFSISRLAQLARAAGIHMIIATQRPSTNIVTGLIKANITCRIALTVASGIDSRVIIDQTGAENLIGKGDMLYSKPEYPKPVRLQGCVTSAKEIEEVVEHLKSQGDPEYHNEILQTNLITLGSSSPDGSGGSSGADDPLLWEAADIVVNSGVGSTSNIQRRLSVGYSRAGRIMDMLEEKGIVGPANGSKPREVLVDAMELESLKAFEANDGE